MSQDGARTLLPARDEQRSLWGEATDMLKLMLPIFITQISWVAMKTTDTALLGHAGSGSSRYLDASALSDLWTSSTGVLIGGRVLGVFCGNAYGAGNKELVGIWLQVSYCVLAMIAIPVMVAWAFTGVALRAFGAEEEISGDAQYYAFVLMWCIPVRVGFGQLAQFFNSMKITRPGAQTSTFSMLLNLTLGLILVLGVPIPGFEGFGFKACPLVTLGVEYVQFLFYWLLTCKCQRLHLECWSGWAPSQITGVRIKRYLKMYVPAALSIASDFWRVAAIGAVAETIGKNELGVFNASYRICWMVLIFVGSLGGALGIKLGIYMGGGKIAETKRCVCVCTAVAVTLLCGLGSIVLLFPRELAAIFSDDAAVIDLFEEVRVPLTTFVFFMNLAVNLERTPMSLGRTKAVLFMGLIGSWVGQVPGVLLCTRLWRNDLVGLYAGASAGYALLCVLYGCLIMCTDWEGCVRQARERAEASSSTGSASAPQVGMSMQETRTKKDARGTA